MTVTIDVQLHGQVVAQALVDDVDAEWAQQTRWRLNSKGYAWSGGKYGQLMHRQLLGLVPGDGLEGDHRDGDRLNNQRSNLRVVTHAQNMQNLPTRQGGSSRFRGVSYHKASGRWQARVRHAGVLHHLGVHDTEEQAAALAASLRARLMTHSEER